MYLYLYDSHFLQHSPQRHRLVKLSLLTEGVTETKSTHAPRRGAGCPCVGTATQCSAAWGHLCWSSANLHRGWVMLRYFSRMKQPGDSATLTWLYCCGSRSAATSGDVCSEISEALGGQQHVCIPGHLSMPSRELPLRRGGLALAFYLRSTVCF